MPRARVRAVLKLIFMIVLVVKSADAGSQVKMEYKPRNSRGAIRVKVERAGEQ
jgi:hypothetical protein